MPDPLKGEPETARRGSSLVQHRYYGFMLGFMCTLLRLPVVGLRFQAHRRRLGEVMAELGIEWTLPESSAAYRADEAIEQHLALDLKLLGKMAMDFFALGQSALHVMVERSSRRGRVARTTVREVVAEYGLREDLVMSRVISGWHQGKRGNRLIAELMSRAYDLVAISMLGLQKEESTCFVIMPFARPYSDYYPIFYRRSLELAGYRALRAWEGLTNEHYMQMIYMLLHRCGAALADVSPDRQTSRPNLNVIHEIGMNAGAGNITYLICQRAQVDLPSNLAGLPIARYRPAARNWPEGQARRIAPMLRELDASPGIRSPQDHPCSAAAGR